MTAKPPRRVTGSIASLLEEQARIVIYFDVLTFHTNHATKKSKPRAIEARYDQAIAQLTISAEDPTARHTVRSRESPGLRSLLRSGLLV